MTKELLRRWLVAGAALLLGGATAAAMLAFANPDAGLQDVFVAARDVAAGSPMRPDMVRLARMRLGEAEALAFSPARSAVLFGARAAHDLTAGQLIQATDVAPAGAAADVRTVYVPVKGVPPLGPGDRVDLLLVSGAAGQLTVQPFLLGVEVRGQAPDGLIVAVSSEQAAALLYAASATRLAAVVASPGSAPGQEPALADLAAAERAAGR